jgi:hypothetical protein
VDLARVGEAVAFADQHRDWLHAQELIAYAPHRLRVQGKPEVELLG